MDALTIKKAISAYYTEDSKPDWYRQKNYLSVGRVNQIRKGVRGVYGFTASGYTKPEFRLRIMEILGWQNEGRSEYGNVQNGYIFLKPEDWEKVINNL